MRPGEPSLTVSRYIARDRTERARERDLPMLLTWDMDTDLKLHKTSLLLLAARSQRTHLCKISV